MKIVDISLLGMGIGLILVSLALRKQAKRNWLGLMAGGITVLVVGVLSAVFKLSL